MVHLNSVRKTIRPRPAVMWTHDGEPYEIHAVRPGEVESQCIVLVSSQGISRSFPNIETSDLPESIIEELREAQWSGLPQRRVTQDEDYIRWRFGTYER